MKSIESRYLSGTIYFDRGQSQVKKNRWLKIGVCFITFLRHNNLPFVFSVSYEPFECAKCFGAISSLIYLKFLAAI
jgi:hypothetical protein